MHHLCWAIKEGIRCKRKQIPCGRLLSEIFTQEADAMKWDEEVEERSAKKKQSSDTQYESPMFVMTPAMARMTKEYTDKLLAEKKQKEAEYLADRDAKLQSLGLENCDEYFVQKIAEVRQIAGSVEQQVVEEAHVGTRVFHKSPIEF